MLRLIINTKQEMIKLLQSAQLKSVYGQDIANTSDISDFTKQIQNSVKSKNQVTVFLVTT